MNSHKLPNNGQNVFLLTLKNIFGSETNSLCSDVLASFEGYSAVLVLLEMVDLGLLAVLAPVN